MDPGTTPKPLNLTAAQVVAALGTNKDNTLAYWPLIAAALDAEGIGDLPVLIAAAATVRVEVGLRFEPIHEYPLAGGGYPSHYSGGGRYHGRGFIQLTHDYNYAAYGRLLGADLFGNPDLALLPDLAARVLASYFRQRDIAGSARAGDWTAVRRKVQGGTAGWDIFHGSVMALEDATAEQGEPSADLPAIVDLRGTLPTNGQYTTRALGGIVGATFHYTAGGVNASPESIAAFHVGPERGWPGIAYTYLVTGDGTPNQVNNLSARSYHSDGPGRNTGWVGICYTGNHSPTEVQLRGMAAALVDVETKLGRQLQTEGHRDASSTSCPGPAWPNWKAPLLAMAGR